MAVPALAGTLFAATLLGSPAEAATTAPLPPPPACASAVATSTGTGTSAPVPLPPPASALGGVQLAQPGLHVSVPVGVARPPALRATAWIVADLSTGNVLAACNAHVPLAPASTLKILTALALHGRIDAGRPYVATDADASIDGTKVGLSPGSRYTVRDLWHGLLLGSGNDTANALASLVGGSAAAAGLLTTTAHALGAGDTVARNTSGLDAAGQVSSVYDLALFGRALLKDPALAALVRTKTYRFPAKGTTFGRTRKSYEIQNHDLLLFNYPGATGIKNGYTKASGASFVGSASRNGHSYVVALLKTDVRSWKLAASLLDWAFAAGGRAAPVGVLDPTPVPASGPPPVPAASAAPSTPQSPAPTTSSSTAGTGSAGVSGPGGTLSQVQPPGGVTAPVNATLDALPSQGRTAWVVVVFAVAFAGAAVVSRLTARRTALGVRTKRPTSRRPASRGSSSKGSGSRRPASPRTSAGKARAAKASPRSPRSSR
jgi:D-alanyl-D-alanine carboxypeptidase (penicillin-binding protein 5/6)